MVSTQAQEQNLTIHLYWEEECPPSNIIFTHHPLRNSFFRDFSGLSPLPIVIVSIDTEVTIRFLDFLWDTPSSPRLKPSVFAFPHDGVNDDNNHTLVLFPQTQKSESSPTGTTKTASQERIGQ